MKKVLLSGIKPTGRLHLGNYFGAIKQMVELSNSDNFDSYIFIANYHALTTVKNKEELLRDTFDIACAYLACGLDSKKVTLFRQSDIPEVHELTWIFNTVVSVPFLSRAHAFKDHEAKSKDVNVGLFDYPVLMASDILMYHADIVPVGQDQKQHVEYARDIAGYFNRAWKEYFKLPKDYIVEGVAQVPGTDGQKMSKSYGNVIPLFGTDDEIKKAVMGIVTDSKKPEEKKNPDENNIYTLHKLFLSANENAALRKRYEQGGLSYREAKEMLLEAILDFVSPLREKYEYYQKHPKEVEAILAKGAEKARIKAVTTMEEVRGIVGLAL